MLTYTIESRLSNSRLSLPSIIRIDVQNFLKQIIRNYGTCDPSFVVY